MCEKSLRVNKWLDSIFGQQAVPAFEVNARTIEVLDQIVRTSEARCEEVRMLITSRRQKASEYSSDASHLKELLHQSVGLQPESVSKSTSDFLSVLEGTADALKVKDTSIGSFVPAINKLTNDLAEAEKTERRLERELSAMRRKVATTMIVQKNLQEDLLKTTQVQQMEAATAEERLLNVDFIKNKSRELTYRNKRAQDKLASRQMEESLTHQSILELSEKITALNQETVPLMKKLEPYSDLSPSPALARVKIEEAKRELAALDAELDQKVDLNALII
ncbi:HAUS augmin-like complex subunit 1 [Hoplias malabaricus]|uniref:HAUS augmin-like complex subunit 1 n=1 Tax=Hoplias malabaricus TaxID=27720 RepID=UPI003462C088